MNRLNQAAIVVLAALFSTAVSAANMVDLKTQNIDILKPLSRMLMTRGSAPSTSIHETGRFTDLKKTVHVRFQQYFRGYPIQNAHGVVHISQAPRLTRALPGLIAAAEGKKTMNGTIYQNLEADLSKASGVVFTEQQAGRAQQFALQTLNETH